MCNAAGKFFAQSLLDLESETGIRAEKRFLSRSACLSDARFTAGLLPTVESPAATGRALCLLL
jgi:hypothetical protein